MRTQLNVKNVIGALAGAVLVMASFSQPSWGVAGVDGMEQRWQDSMQQISNYEPPDNGKPDSTGDTGGR